jgi:hypothetical protein
MPTDDHAADLRAAANLRAAAERLRANEYLYRKDPFGQIAEDHERLADAYLDEHLEDDGERITDDWLLSVGGEELTAGGKRRGIAVGTQPGMVLCWRWGHPDNRGWSLEHWDSNGECGWLELAAEPQTRGDFRRLAAALGVALKPAGGD